MNPTTHPINSSESDWIKAQISHASGFVSKYANGRSLTLETLESAWDAWIASNPTDTEDVNSIINAVGCAFGQSLVESTAFNWVIAEDSNGADLAIFAEPGRGDFLVFPANLMAKRWASRTSGFICALASELAAKVRSAGIPDIQKKPWWRLW